MRIDGPIWVFLVGVINPNIADEIFAKLETTRDQHSGASFISLLGYYRNLARTGFSDRFLLKNQHLCVMGYYMPDYFPEALFLAGAGVIAALSL